MEFLKTQSDDISDLNKFLSLARKEFKPLVADTKGQYGEYASSDAIKAAVGEALDKYEIIFEQASQFVFDRIFLESKLSRHGQWKAWYMPMDLPEKPRSIDQAKGSAYTYQKRYAAYGIFDLGKGDGTDDPDLHKPQYINQIQIDSMKRAFALAPEMEERLYHYFSIGFIKELPAQYVQEAFNLLKKWIEEKK